MRLIRKPVLLVLAVAASFAGSTTCAFAVTAYDESTGANLAVGAGYTATAQGNTTFSGTFFGLSITTICTGSTMDGAITANPSASGNVVGSITSLTYSGCSSNIKNPCTVTAGGLPWNSSNNGGFVADATSVAHRGFGTSGTVNLSDCVSGFCTVKGGNASASWGLDTLKNYVNAAWDNTRAWWTETSQTVVAASCTLTAGSHSATFGFKTTLGHLIGFR